MSHHPKSSLSASGKRFLHAYLTLTLVVSGVLIVGVGAASWLIHERAVVADAELQAVALSRGITDDELAELLARCAGTGHLSVGSEEAADISARLGRFMSHFDLHQLLLLDRRGHTVFAQVPGPEYASALAPDELAAVWGGRVVTRVHRHAAAAADGADVEAVLTGVPLDGPRGERLGVLLVCADVTEHMAAAARTRNLLLAVLAGLIVSAGVVKSGAVWRLCRRIDATNRELAASRRDQAELNIDLQRINERLVATEAEARGQAGRARDADEAKTVFLANMSHEMRTPLTCILGLTELCLDDGPGEDPEIREHRLVAVQRNGRQLLSLIEDLLTVTELHRGTRTARIRTDRVETLLADATADARGRAEAKGLSFAVRRVGAVPVEVATDHDRVRLALTKLLDNAVKFTTDGGVELEFGFVEPPGEGGPALLFRVLDRGCGLPAAIRRGPGQAFRLGDAAASRSHGGSGLGLHIARAVTDLLGGHLVAYDREGGGSSVELQVGAEPVGDARLADAPPPPPCDTDLSGLRVLYAEDGPDNQFLVRTILKKAGAEVDIAVNGAVALEMEAAGRYDLILMDIQMPVMDGLEATRTLRTRGCGLPILALTANAMDSDRAASAAAGCDRHLTKPINRRGLLQAVDEACRRAAAVRLRNRAG